jgi:hypothetical protein
LIASVLSRMISAAHQLRRSVAKRTWSRELAARFGEIARKRPKRFWLMSRDGANSPSFGRGNAPRSPPTVVSNPAVIGFDL